VAFILGAALVWTAHVLGGLRRNRSLVWDFVRRDMKARYAGASLSFFWSVVAPLINLVVFMFVFQLIMGARWGDRMTPHEVTLLMLTGIIVWTAFSETLFRSTTTMVDNTNLIQKVVFPSEVLPAFLSISSLINMCFGIPIVLAGMTWIGNYSQTYLGERQAAIEAGKEVGAALGWGPALVVLPVLFALQLVFTTGLGFMLATLNVLLRDVQHLIGILLMVWMFSTPIFYPAELVAMKGYGVMLQVNPMYWLIDAYRAPLLYGQWPEWSLIWRFSAAALLSFALGARMLVLHKPRFPDML
jgi:ABC-type polysaccharide/polyol phosphate export permease